MEAAHSIKLMHLPDGGCLLGKMPGYLSSPQVRERRKKEEGTVLLVLGMGGSELFGYALFIVQKTPGSFLFKSIIRPLIMYSEHCIVCLSGHDMGYD